MEIVEESRNITDAPEGTNKMDIPFITSAPETAIRFPIHDLMSEIRSVDNISGSFDYIVNHLECAEQRDNIRPKKSSYCQKLKSQFYDGSFRITENDFREMEVTDGYKTRIVQCPTVYHRVGCNGVMVPFEKYAYTTLINNTAASIKGRGMHWLHDILETDLLAHPELMYFYQCDIHHYYDSIDQSIMKQQIRKYTDDPELLPMLDNFVELLPVERGLSKGLRASQCFANLHLNDIDHAMTARTPYYYRYCDDIVIIAPTKKELWQHRDCLVGMLAELGLHIKPNEAVRPTSTGIDFLGYITFTDDTKGTRVVYSRIRKRTKQKFARRINRVQSRKRRQSLIGSFFGMAAHADCRHLLKTLLTPKEYFKLKHKRKMKEFSNFDLKPTTFNGKKSFKGQNISSSELDRKGIVVVDYETDLIPTWDKDAYNQKRQDASLKGVDPNEVPKPKPKTLISIIHEGRMRKLWTGDVEILEILKQIESANGFPFFVGIEIDFSGRYRKINFVSAQKLNLTPPSDEYVNRILEMNNIPIKTNN